MDSTEKEVVNVPPPPTRPVPPPPAPPAPPPDRTRTRIHHRRSPAAVVANNAAVAMAAANATAAAVGLKKPASGSIDLGTARVAYAPQQLDLARPRVQREKQDRAPVDDLDVAQRDGRHAEAQPPPLLVLEHGEDRREHLVLVLRRLERHVAEARQKVLQAACGCQ